MTRRIDTPPPGSQGSASITQVLNQQLTALAEIEAVLEKEHAALESRSSADLLTVADEKNTALLRLGELENQRKSLSLELESDHIKQLREIAARCREMNQHNAALLNAQQAHVDRLLGLLRGSRNANSAAYDASGKKTTQAPRQLKLTQV